MELKECNDSQMETEKPEIFKLFVIATTDDLTKETDLIKRQKDVTENLQENRGSC